MDGLFVDWLVSFIIDTYIVLLFVRMFTRERERYDAVLGVVFKATDPVLAPLARNLPGGTAHLAPLAVIIALLLIKGILVRSIPYALQSFADTFLQFYVLLILITAMVQEYYINPIAEFGQRIVRPVRAVMANVARQPVAVHLLAVGALVVVHTALTLVLHTMLPGAPSMLPKTAFIRSLALLVNLAGFFVVVIIVNALLTWVSPDPLNPIVQLLTLISAPIIDPIRRVIPPLGGMIDISPILAIIALQLVQRILLEVLASV